MKKRIVLVFVSIFCLICLFAACSRGIEQNPRLSELRSDILIGENGNLSAVVVTGIREEPFEIDGFSNSEKSYFTVITVTPDTFNPLAEYTFSVTVNDKEFSGELVKHPFNQSYSAELAVLSPAVMSIGVTSGTDSSIITVESVKTDSYIDGGKAFSVAQKTLKDKVESAEGEYEIFVRLIENPINSAGGYFWYVAYIYASDQTLAVLIDPVTMEIMAVRD